MRFVRLGMCFIVAALFAVAPLCARASDQAPADGSQWAIGAGVVLPNEGDLDAGWALSLGYKYKMGNDIVFMDYLYAQTETNVATGPLRGKDVNHNVVNLGYMFPVTANQKVRLGGCLQVHQMDFGSGIKMTRTTPSGLLEYDLSDRLTMRLQSASPAKENQVRFGSTVTAMLQWNL